jgi:hypothetical protein|tara:strand:- start:585 stop:872 length:288 start_codon:yes stop_codon:yes gene_type:complete
MKKTSVKERRKTYAFLLALPPTIALIMIGIVSFTHKAIVIAPEGLMMSPVKDTSPLILSLSIFILGYLVFISLLFKDSIHLFFVEKVMHKKIKLP